MDIKKFQKNKKNKIIGIRITQEDKDFLKKNNIQFSKLVRETINELKKPKLTPKEIKDYYRTEQIKDKIKKEIKE